MASSVMGEPQTSQNLWSLYSSPLYVRYGPENWIKLLGHYGVSEAFKSVQCGGNPIIISWYSAACVALTPFHMKS